ncbi:DNA-binding protein [Paenibacillus sp. UMB4589-SE434]|uniref:DNA-binding protein n=1 Tax=Paenibacillus sp. UMB4589-SE434 TaxID=3046314 RepID=UPI0025518B0F|nr:DNA-binding protein [Paenibacillus sp. UMB4589-SE434]MDK8182069.1 DNA-binding protein [Paenibacillus sp. UMB4589-SE434]
MVREKIIHWDKLPDEMSAQNIADIFQISRRKVYEFFDRHPSAGGIPNYQIDGTRRAEKEDVRRWRDSKKSNK